MKYKHTCTILSILFLTFTDSAMAQPAPCGIGPSSANPCPTATPPGGYYGGIPMCGVSPFSGIDYGNCTTGQNCVDNPLGTGGTVCVDQPTPEPTNPPAETPTSTPSIPPSPSVTATIMSSSSSSSSSSLSVSSSSSITPTSTPTATPTATMSTPTPTPVPQPIFLRH